jgi:uncharacterized protein (TIGR00369 family)
MTHKHPAPPDPDFIQKTKDSFALQGLMQHLGARITELKSGFCEIRADFRPHLSQQHGYFHAGVAGAIADSACGYAAYTLMPAGSNVLTVEYKLNLLAPAAGETLIARGRVTRAGRTLTVCHADVFVLGGTNSRRIWNAPPTRSGSLEPRGTNEMLCATSLSTIMTLAPNHG